MTRPTLSIAIARTKPDRAKASVEGDITETRTLRTAKGGVLAIVTVRDQSGDVECLVFPKNVGAMWSLLMDGRIAVTGSVEQREAGETRLLVDSIEAVGPPVGDWRPRAAHAGEVGEA